MAIEWPPQLQQLLSTDSFNYMFGETTIRSDMDVGPAKVRRRFTAGVDTLSCSIQMSYENFQILRDFFDVTLNGGVNQFEYTHPFTQELALFRMVGPPSLRPLGNGGVEYEVSMKWEVLPNA